MKEGMMNMKRSRILSVLLCLAMAVSLFSGCQKKPAEPAVSAPGSASIQPDASQPDASAPAAERTQVNFTVLSGPTGVGAAYLIDNYSADAAAADSPIVLNSTVVADNSEVMAALTSGETDIAAIATNVASTLYNKTEGKITMLAVNTLGVLYILEKGDSVQSMADLKGKTIYATGQGANPEYILNYLLTSNGVDPASDVTIEWLTAQEIATTMASAEEGVCMLPVPAATALLMKDSGVRQALDLTAEWDAVSSSPLAMGCVVARTEFIQEHPEAVDAFLDLYGDSISFMSDENNLEDAANLVAKYEITANAQIAKSAIPQCNLTCLTGADMRETIQNYFAVLNEANPAAIGGAMPYDDFYYLP